MTRIVIAMLEGRRVSHRSATCGRSGLEDRCPGNRKGALR